MTMEFKQFNLLKKPVNDGRNDSSFVVSANIIRSDKTFNIKDRFIVNDKEVINRIGQVFNRTTFSTLVSGSVYSASAVDYLIGITSLSYAPTIGLPRPSLIGPGKTYIIKDEVGGALTTNITIRSVGEETINGAATNTIITNYGAVTLYSDGANWFTISSI